MWMWICYSSRTLCHCEPKNPAEGEGREGNSALCGWLVVVVIMSKSRDII